MFLSLLVKRVPVDLILIGGFELMGTTRDSGKVTVSNECSSYLIFSTI